MIKVKRNHVQANLIGCIFISKIFLQSAIRGFPTGYDSETRKWCQHTNKRALSTREDRHTPFSEISKKTFLSALLIRYIIL